MTITIASAWRTIPGSAEATRRPVGSISRSSSSAPDSMNGISPAVIRSTVAAFVSKIPTRSPARARTRLNGRPTWPPPPRTTTSNAPPAAPGSTVMRRAVPAGCRPSGCGARSWTSPDMLPAGGAAPGGSGRARYSLMVERMKAGRSRAAALGSVLQRRPWPVYLVLALLAFPILEMLVAGDRAVEYAHDVFDDDVPRLFSIASDWKAFGPHLWDPHLTAGNALLAHFALPPSTPDVLLSFIVPPFAAYVINATLMAFVAGLGMHLFLRDSLRLPGVACFAGGVLAALSFWHYIFGYGALVLPLLLWSADRALAGGTVPRRRVVWAIAVVWFALLSSQIQLVVIGGAATLAYVLATAEGIRAWPGRIARLATIWGVAALLAGPILITQLAAIPDSHRAIWDLAYLIGPLGLAVRNAGLLYGSVAIGLPVTADVGGSAAVYGSFFPGAIALPLLAFSLGAPRRSARERAVLGILVASPVIDLLAILGMPIQDHLWVLRTFQFVRIRHLLPVLVAMNVAVAVAFVVRSDPSHALSRRRWLAASVLVALAAAAPAWRVAHHRPPVSGAGGHARRRPRDRAPRVRSGGKRSGREPGQLGGKPRADEWPRVHRRTSGRGT